MGEQRAPDTTALEAPGRTATFSTSRASPSPDEHDQADDLVAVLDDIDQSLIDPGGVVVVHGGGTTADLFDVRRIGLVDVARTVSTSSARALRTSTGQASQTAQIYGVRCIGQAVPGHLRLRRARARRSLLVRGAGLRRTAAAGGLRHLGRLRPLAAAEEQGRVRSSDPSGVGPRLFFQRVPEGKAVKNRVHLDVRVGTGLVGEERLAALEAECARLIALGATRVQLLLADEDNESCMVMQDVEGNEFCLD